MTIRTRLFSFHIKAKLFNIHLFNCEYKSFLLTENWLQFLKLQLVSSLLIWEKSASPKRGWKGPLAVLKVKHKSRPGERGKARYGLSFLSSQGCPREHEGQSSGLFSLKGDSSSGGKICLNKKWSSFHNLLHNSSSKKTLLPSRWIIQEEKPPL